MKKVVVITGASKGLGYELSKQYNYNQYELVLISRNITTRSDLIGIKIDLDLTNQDSIVLLCDYLIGNNLIPDILIHNLGGKIEGDSHPICLDTLKKTIQLNLEISIDINNRLIDRMIEKKNCSIIHIGSDSSLTGNASPCYVIAKSSLNAYVLNLAGKLSDCGISIHAFLLGPFIYKNSYWFRLKHTNPIKYKNKLKSLNNKRFWDAKELAEIIFRFSISGKQCTYHPLIFISSEGDIT